MAGRWSLVDGDDGTCRALWNPPTSVATDRVSPLEREVASLLAIGHTNKLVAYELGIAEGTVSALVHRLRRKLGVGSRPLLVVACQRVHDDSRVERASLRLDALSEAEREVVRAAAHGLSNAAIAASRGRSVRTIENILAAAYAKLGVRSRGELVARRFDETV